MFLPSLPVRAALIEHIGVIPVKPGTFVPMDDIVVSFTHAHSGEEFVLLASRIVGLVVEPETEPEPEQAAQEAAEDLRAA
ncbi:hypothetical protein [Nonomuraea rubra]|uniref:hypothetical protein n=1 Tax=Nonomuraea rubra TaxID=46180 RepID=UPI003410DAAA